MATARTRVIDKRTIKQWCLHHRGFLCGWGAGLAIVLGWWL